MGEHGQCPTGRPGRGHGAHHTQVLAGLWLSTIRGSFEDPLSEASITQITHHRESVKIRNCAAEVSPFILVSG